MKNEISFLHITGIVYGYGLDVNKLIFCICFHGDT